MNRTSRRSTAEAAEALLEVGRSEPVLHYDVELGLSRHHQWLRSDAPMPEWASASVGGAAKSLVPVVVKTVVSALLMGALAVAAWHARGGPQPSAAVVQRPSSSAEPTQADAPRIRDVTAFEAEAEASMAPKPIPIPDQGALRDEPRRRTARADVPDKRATRVQRTHKDLAAPSAASARVEPTVARAESVPHDATSARVESAASATTPRSEGIVERASQPEAAAAPERKPSSVAQRARPEPGSQAQGPDDLVEMQQVATAEQLLDRSPARALALVRQGDQRFARGYFQQERAYIAIMALIRLGRMEEARTRAASFARQFPALPYGARIRSALEAREAAAPSATSRDAVP